MTAPPDGYAPGAPEPDGSASGLEIDERAIRWNRRIGILLAAEMLVGMGMVVVLASLSNVNKSWFGLMLALVGGSAVALVLLLLVVRAVSRHAGPSARSILGLVLVVVVAAPFVRIAYVVGIGPMLWHRQCTNPRFPSAQAYVRFLGSDPDHAFGGRGWTNIGGRPVASVARDGDEHYERIHLPYSDVPVEYAGYSRSTIQIVLPAETADAIVVEAWGKPDAGLPMWPRAASRVTLEADPLCPRRKLLRTATPFLP